MESNSISLFSGMHCIIVLSFFIGRMQLDKANIASSLFLALHSLCPPAACAGKKLGGRRVHPTAGAPLHAMMDAWLRNKSTITGAWLLMFA
jgi:hypothetical protein